MDPKEAKQKTFKTLKTYIPKLHSLSSLIHNQNKINAGDIFSAIHIVQLQLELSLTLLIKS